ncbi:hypothetical protein [Glaciecola sp. 1036]|uniref:hypothetical protein n=1 Tax=Alteromonadaceae TaxID=72275 RepID=UPI003D032737
MTQLDKAIINDLILLYQADEASAQTRSYLEQIAKTDHALAAQLAAKVSPLPEIKFELDNSDIAQKTTLTKIQSRFKKQIAMLAVITFLLLCIPFSAMQISGEVNWTVFDFLVMGGLIFGAGMLLLLLIKESNKWGTRFAYAIYIGLVFLTFWINLAVGIIGEPDNTINLVYYVSLVLSILALFWCRGRSKPASIIMLLNALSFLLIPALSELTLPGSISDSQGALVVTLFSLISAAGFLMSAFLLYRNR